MCVRLEDDVARLSGVCGPEEAAELADWLRTQGRDVEMDGVEHLHAAVLQCLMALKARIRMVRTAGAIAVAVRSSCGENLAEDEGAK